MRSRPHLPIDLNHGYFEMLQVIVRRQGAIVLGMLIILSVGGCAESEVPIVPARGVVKINGKPAPNIAVQFMPNVMTEGKGPTSYGTTNENGEFVLKTHDGRDGAVVGTHMVTLVDMDEERVPQGKVAPPPRIQSRYQVARPDFTFEVKPDNEPIVIDVR